MAKVPVEAHPGLESSGEPEGSSRILSVGWNRVEAAAYSAVEVCRK